MVHRSRFRPDQLYAGRLLRVCSRPIENRSKSICLLRLEFEMFQILEDRCRLVSHGKLACRDLVLVPGVEQDDGVAPFASALGIHQPERFSSWVGLPERKPWVKVVFGQVDPVDDRNVFRQINPFDPRNYEVVEWDYTVGAKWVEPGQIPDELGVDISKSTVLRRINSWEKEYGQQLVQRTRGKHRRVNLNLIRHLWATWGWPTR